MSNDPVQAYIGIIVGPKVEVMIHHPLADSPHLLWQVDVSIWSMKFVSGEEVSFNIFVGS